MLVVSESICTRKPFQRCLMSAGKAWSLPQTKKYTATSGKEKIFYNIDTWGQSYKKILCS